VVVHPAKNKLTHASDIAAMLILDDERGIPWLLNPTLQREENFSMAEEKDLNCAEDASYRMLSHDKSC
jgi:hypothetical protein